MAVRAPRLPDRTAAALLANSSVSANPTDDLLTFSVADPDPGGRHATGQRVREGVHAVPPPARQRGTLRGTPGHSTEAGRDRGSGRRRICAVPSRRGYPARSGGPADAAGELPRARTLVGLADSASLVQPKTKRNVILGVIVGLALGIALAFVRETLDTRVHSADELRELLGVPLLGQVPKPARRRRAG